jgi:hypothetical protein
MSRLGGPRGTRCALSVTPGDLTGKAPRWPRRRLPTRLIVPRGNGASGKSAGVTALRERYGRGVALARQDLLRREVLRERDIPGGANIGVFEETLARHATKPFADEVTEEQLRG